MNSKYESKIYEAMKVVRHGKKNTKGHCSQSYFGIIPKEVLQELRGAAKSTDSVIAELARIWHSKLSQIKVVGKRESTGKTSVTPSTHCSGLLSSLFPSPGLYQLVNPNDFIWPPLRKFLRSTDTRILAHTLFFLDPKEAPKKQSTVSLACGGKRWTEDETKRVVLVTSDQVMSLKGTAVYDLTTVPVEVFIKVMLGD